MKLDELQQEAYKNGISIYKSGRGLRYVLKKKEDLQNKLTSL
jgi:hypothetical protein